MCQIPSCVDCLVLQFQVWRLMNRYLSILSWNLIGIVLLYSYINCIWNLVFWEYMPCLYIFSTENVLRFQDLINHLLFVKFSFELIAILWVYLQIWSRLTFGGKIFSIYISRAHNSRKWQCTLLCRSASSMCIWIMNFTG